MSSLLEQLKKKPVPKKKESIELMFEKREEPAKEDVIELQTKIIDESSSSAPFDRKAFLERLAKRAIVVPKISQAVRPPPTPSTKDATVKPKKRLVVKTKTKLRLVDPSRAGPADTVEPKKSTRTVMPEHIKRLSKTINKGTITGTTAQRPMYRRTARVDKSIVREGPIESLIMDETSIKERLPEEAPPGIRASSYYMNNREMFVDFINTLFMDYRDELLDDSSKETCESRKERKGFSLLTHQKIVRDYLNLYTPYRGLLLYHGLGSGKTCSSIAIAEGMKDSKPVMVMTPASLRANYIEQLKFCGDLLYKKTQYWEKISVRSNPEYVEPLASILSLEPAYIEEKGEVWMVNAKKDSNFETLTTEEKESLNDQLDIMIRAKYSFISYNGLRKEHIKTLTQNGTVNPFDNKVVIIDEAHNFISRIVNKLKRKSAMVLDLYEFLLSATNCRIVLLSGTPIINYPNELGVMFNILRGYIYTYKFPLSVSSTKKIDNDYFKKLFEKYAIYDYVDYNASNTTLTITRNPFGFVNRLKSGEYKGVKFDERGQISNDDFISFVAKKLEKSGLTVASKNATVEQNKALPDDIEEFRNLFIHEDGDLYNSNLLKRRIVGLASYFRDIEELMPEYNEDLNFHEVPVTMSDDQFAIYETARQAERKQEKNSRKKRKKKQNQDDIYDDAVSTYRIFSRLFCNFVFPSSIKRPLPRDADSIEDAVKESGNEFDVDGASAKDKVLSSDGQFDNEDEKQLEDESKKNKTDAYKKALDDALGALATRGDEYLSKEGLATLSPKFLHMLENIEDPEHNGLHLIYSQFRTMEGVGIFELVLRQNGFSRFAIKKVGDKWALDISEEDFGKPMYAMYTGTETPEEKEIIRNIFNSDWKYVPNTIKTQLEEKSSNNYYGEIIKVLMITAAGAEGVNLKNVRYVHLMEPYWHPVRLEQVIGRARRICSHENLIEAHQNIEVFLYIMTLSEDQKAGEESLELRKHDTSKLDRVTPLTTDESLFEISTIKKNINKQLLRAIKEASIDCAIHTKSGSKEPLECFTFGSTNVNQLAYKPGYSKEERDDVADINREKVTWAAKTFKLKGKQYKLRLNEDGSLSNKVYDYDSFEAAKKTGTVNPIFLGVLVRDGKKAKIVFD